MGRSNGEYLMGRAQLAAFGFVGGVAAGLAMWSAQLHRYRRDLFSRSAVRRMAALGYLSGQSGAGTARLLHEYVQWEPTPLLRRRAEQLLRDMAHDLD